MWTTMIRGIIAGIIVMAVTELSRKNPRAGAILLTLPLVSILAFIMSWNKFHSIGAISLLARESLILVPLGLPFFLPIAFAEMLGLSFWTAIGLGILLATMTIGTWFWLGPQLS